MDSMVRWIKGRGIIRLGNLMIRYDLMTCLDRPAGNLISDCVVSLADPAATAAFYFSCEQCGNMVARMTKNGENSRLYAASCLLGLAGDG